MLRFHHFSVVEGIFYEGRLLLLSFLGVAGVVVKGCIGEKGDAVAYEI